MPMLLFELRCRGPKKSIDKSIYPGMPKLSGGWMALKVEQPCCAFRAWPQSPHCALDRDDTLGAAVRRGGAIFGWRLGHLRQCRRPDPFLELRRTGLCFRVSQSRHGSGFPSIGRTALGRSGCRAPAGVEAAAAAAAARTPTGSFSTPPPPTPTPQRLNLRPTRHPTTPAQATYTDDQSNHMDAAQPPIRTPHCLWNGGRC